MKMKEQSCASRRNLLWPGVFAVLLFAVLVLCTMNANAASVVASGNCGKGVTWSLDSDGTLTIGGKGEMEDYWTDDNAPWYAYKKDVKKVIIKNGVTSIGRYAFNDCSALKNVMISDSVTRIGGGAFNGTERFRNAANWSGDAHEVLYIGDYLISAVSDLISGTYTIKSGTKCIAESAFGQCSMLKRVIIPNSVTSIGPSAFYGCTGLQIAKIPKSVNFIDQFTFYGCTSLKSVTIPNSVIGISDSAFEGCSALKSVTIPKSVVGIGNWGFSKCNNLKTVKILNPKCEIRYEAFDTPATIYGYKNSTAQEYAEDYDLEFVAFCTHTYGSTLYTKQATTTANGKTYKRCTLCGAAKTVTVIPKVSTLKLSKTSYAYTGKARTPTLIIQDANGKTLQKNTDYKVAYAKGRTECGTYKVVVKLMGNYSGKTTLKFKIKLAKVTGITQTSSKGVYLKWNAVTGATRYDIYVYSGGKYNRIKSDTDTWVENKTLTTGQKVTMQIRAVRVLANGTETYSAVTYTATAK